MTETAEESKGLIERSRSFVADVQGEFNKITWPPQPEMVSGTIAVLVIVAVMATFLSIVDYILSHLMRWVLG